MNHAHYWLIYPGNIGICALCGAQHTFPLAWESLIKTYKPNVRRYMLEKKAYMEAHRFEYIEDRQDVALW